MQHYIGSLNTQESQLFTIMGQDESQWEVVLEEAGVVQVLYNFDHTLAGLVASGNVARGHMDGGESLKADDDYEDDWDEVISGFFLSGSY